MAYMYSNECGVCDRRFGSINKPARVCPECHNAMVPYAEELGNHCREIQSEMVKGHFIDAHHMLKEMEKLIKEKFTQKKNVGRDCYKIGGKWDEMRKQIQDKQLKSFIKQ